MRTRITAVIVAVVLAVVGGVVLVTYVQSANSRAFNGAELVDIVVAAQPIPVGTSGDALADLVSTEAIAKAYVVDGAVTDLTALTGLVASSQIEVGEQVLAARFETPGQFVSSAGSVPVPDGLDEMSFSVDSPRVLGGRLVPGDTISVFVSLDGEGDVPDSTSSVLDHVLVTSVTTGAVVPDTIDAATTDAIAQPLTGGLVLVSVAVSADEAQKLVYGSEFGHIWVARQSDTSAEPTHTTIESGAVK